VVEVNVDPESQLVEFRIGHREGKLVFPECQQACPQADLAAERIWRHLDLLQFETRIRARVPRCDCEQSGVKSTAGPVGAKALAVYEPIRGGCSQGSQRLQFG
jgi:transposase